MSIKNKREEFNTLRQASEELQNKVVSEDREFTADEKTEQDKRFARMEVLKAQLENDKRLATFAIESDVKPVVKAVEPDGFNFADNAKVEVKERKFTADDRNKVVNFWARTAQVPQQFATVTTASNSSLLLPKQVSAPIVPTALNVFRAAHNLTGVSVYRTPSTAEIDIPVLAANAGGALAENVVSSNIGATDQDNVPAFASLKTKPTGFHSGALWYSNQQLNAVDFDLLGTSIPAMEYQKELGFESAKIAAMKADAGLTNVVTTPAGDATIVYGNLVSLNRALPKRYDAAKVIVLSKAAYILVEGMVNSQGTPILVTDTQDGSLKRFNGTPVIYSDYLDNMGASAFIGFVVSLLGARMRETTQDTVERYVSVPQRPGQQGFDYISYMDWSYDPAAVAKLMTPAS